MRYLFLSCLVLLSSLLQAQYYYNDLVATTELNERMSVLTRNRVTAVSAAGYDERGIKNTDFNEWQDINDNGTSLRLTTRNRLQKSSLYYTFDGRQRVIAVTDSAGATGSKTTYQYDPEKGLLTSLLNSTRDAEQGIDQQELHRWIYAADGKPEKMYRIINNTDTTEYRFGRDEKGNVSDEQVYRRGVRFGEPVYFYYDDQHRLTDIVRYDKRVRMLMPELLFEYDAAGRVIQKMIVTSNINKDYLIWRYQYNDKGLKTKEVLFNKHKEQTGKIEYSYITVP